MCEQSKKLKWDFLQQKNYNGVKCIKIWYY